tara:strand:+ start:457 stop:969 length:513 start_codon:yes stop_codon:yes gene_type:complete
MATRGNHLYNKGILNMLSGNLGLPSQGASPTKTWTLTLVNSTYATVGGSVDLNNDQFYSTALGITPGQSTGGNQIGNQIALTNATASADVGTGIGIAIDAADTVFTGVTAGSTVNGIVMFQSGATPGTDDYLISYWDEDDGSPISIITNGGDITVQWNSDGIFMISGGVA